MAKVIRYTFLGQAVEMGWNEANEETARREADGGEYEIVDADMAEEEGDSAPSVWDELDAAYEAGYREGVNAV